MSIPRWRYVNYTDDGCAVFQCLACKGQWEGRSEPGWFDCYEEVPEPTEDSFTVLVGEEKKPRHTRKRDTPIYKPVWRFCPLCGCEWEGPIECSDDNERMFGPKRAAKAQRVRAILDTYPLEKRYGNHHEPEWWWVLQTREVWPDRDEPEEWSPKHKINPYRVGAVRALEILRREQKDLKTGTEEDSLFGVREEARLIKMTRGEMDGKPWYRQIYEVT